MTPGNVDADAWRLVVIVAACTAVAVRPDVALGQVPAMWWICGLLLAGWVWYGLGGGEDADGDGPDDDRDTFE